MVLVDEWVVIDMVCNCEGGRVHKVEKTHHRDNNHCSKDPLCLYSALSLSLAHLRFIFRLKSHFIFSFTMHSLNYSVEKAFDSD